MRATDAQTFTVPGAATASTRPMVIARGTDVPVRVLVRNVGAVPLFVAFADQDVVTAEGPSSKTFQIDPLSSDVFVLAPEQMMFAVGAVVGGRVSVSVSEALPLL